MNLPKGGETILYTGLLYQLVPYIDSMVSYLRRLEIRGGGLLKLGKIISKIVDISKIVSQVSKEDIMRQHEIIRNIAYLLKKINIEFGYLYEDELYSGILLYDLGRDDVFKEHIKKVYESFRKYDVKSIITIDPHTTHALRSIYPEFLPKFEVNVNNYLEVLNEADIRPEREIRENVTIHDPCYYARYEGIVEEPRILLKKAGAKIFEVERNRELTFCCGGPIESISPRLSREIAKIRVEELKRASNNIIVMCPLCYSNLKRVVGKGVNLTDISFYLYRAFG